MTALEAIIWVEFTTPVTAGNRFGSDPHKIYRDIAKLCHPDVVPANMKKRAEQATVKLNGLFAALNGKAKPVSATLIGDWVVEEPMAKGDICDLYRASSKTVERAVFKIARSPKDNDLMAAEQEAYKTLAEDGPYKHYLPALHASFTASGKKANVLSFAEGHHSLAHLQELFPDGIDFWHVIWMANRLFSVMGYAHRNGIVHGAIFPEHLLYDTKHHLTLVDWCYSVKAGEPLRAILKKHAHEYPKEISRKLPASPALDIYLAAKAIRKVAKDIPKRFNALFSWCQAESPQARPQDAWELQDRWNVLAKEEYGPPKFRKLELPIH